MPRSSSATSCTLGCTPLASEVPHRKVATALTLTVLIGLLVVFAVVGFNKLFAPIDDSGTNITTDPTCTPQQVRSGRVKATDVTVSVFNASDRAGLANETLSSLAERGFTLGDAGNAPDGTNVRYVQVWTTEKGDLAARLVARQFGEGTVIKVGDDLGAGVDVVVGQDFKGLVEGAPTSLRSRGTEEVCVPLE